MTEFHITSHVKSPAGRPALDQAAILEAYWREIRGAQVLPARTSVDPQKIDAALPNSFIIERVAPRVARFRVCGQRINQMIGSDGRGMPMTVLFTPEGRTRLEALIQAVFETPALVDVPLFSARSLVRPRLTGRLLLLPLQSADGSVSRALGAAFVDGPLGAAARAFDILEDGRHRVEPLAPLAASGPWALVPGVSADLPKTETPTKGWPTLRLVVDNS